MTSKATTDPHDGGASRLGWRLGALALVLATVTACNVNPFRLGGDDLDAGDITRTDALDDGDGGVGVDADTTPDAMPPPDACIPGLEVCDGIDNNCDGVADEGFDLMNDPANCGGCGITCDRPGATGTCNMGSCEYTCQPNNYDLNGDLNSTTDSNGCEYFCNPPNPGVEVCDFADNDCNGMTDEGFDTTSDVNNCGGCGNKCILQNATAKCVDSKCEVDMCDDNFLDRSDTVPGCEYACPVVPQVAETCNGKDDDCDGMIDQGIVTGGACYDFASGCDVGLGTCQGECKLGTEMCSFGVTTCQNQVGPTGETCNDKDDDCDGTIDNGFNKATDIRTCGSCSPCQLDNAVPQCVDPDGNGLGECTILQCLNGFVDENNDPSDGCEYECTPSGPEVCDGIDNDCDRQVDELGAAPDGIGTPPAICRTAGECATAGPPVCKMNTCTGTVQWVCEYGGDTELDACGDPVLEETLCDEKDNDCDGNQDEPFALKGQDCFDNELGACLDQGTYACMTDKTGLECDFGALDPNANANQTAEACDGVDNDCDGVIDNDAPDDWVRVTNAGLGLDFWIYRYEASRPDANATSAGSMTHRSCSSANPVPRMPWANPTWTQADAACKAALPSGRLCTEVEWMAACAGTTDKTYPYGNTYDSQACNGREFDDTCSNTPQLNNEVHPSGTNFGAVCAPPTAPLCTSDDGAFDMSGNLREWTSTVPVGAPAGTYRIRGGGYDNLKQALTCQFDFTSADETFHFDNLGFRCCSSTDPSL